MSTERVPRAPDHSDNVWRDLLTLLEVGLVFAASAWALQWAGVLPSVSVGEQVVVVLAAIAVAITNLFGSMAYGRAAYHRKGFELCIVTVGAVFATYATVFTSYRLEEWSDLISEEGRLKGMPEANEASGTLVWLFLVLVAALLMLLLTARLARAVTREEPKYPELLSGLAYICGVISLGLYVFLLLVMG